MEKIFGDGQMAQLGHIQNGQRDSQMIIVMLKTTLILTGEELVFGMIDHKRVNCLLFVKNVDLDGIISIALENVIITFKQRSLQLKQMIFVNLLRSVVSYVFKVTSVI